MDSKPTSNEGLLSVSDIPKSYKTSFEKTTNSYLRLPIKSQDLEVLLNIASMKGMPKNLALKTITNLSKAVDEQLASDFKDEAPINTLKLLKIKGGLPDFLMVEIHGYMSGLLAFATSGLEKGDMSKKNETVWKDAIANKNLFGGFNLNVLAYLEAEFKKKKNVHAEERFGKGPGKRLQERKRATV